MRFFLATLALLISSLSFANPTAKTCITGQGCLYMTTDAVNNRVIYADQNIYNKVDNQTRMEFHQAGFLLASVTPVNKPALESSTVASGEMTVDQLSDVSNKAGTEAFFTGAGCATAVYFCGNSALNPATWLFTKVTCVSAGLACSYALIKYDEWKEAQKKWNDAVKATEGGAGLDSSPQGVREVSSSHSDFSGAVIKSTDRLPMGHTISIDCPDGGC